MTVAPREIFDAESGESSMWLWLGGAGLCAAYLALARHPGWWAWLILAFFVLTAVLEHCGRNIPPVRLVLDAEGFEIAGGFNRQAPRPKTPWSDIETFFVMDLPRPQYGRQQRVVGFRYRPEAQTARGMAGTVNRLTGIDGWLPVKWPKSHEAIVDELNEYRRMAVQARDATPG